MLDFSSACKLISVLLAYPDGEAFRQSVSEALAACQQAEDDSLCDVLDHLQHSSVTDLARCYVATFDLQESTALYLTAHELGDSRERGGALLELHQMLRAGGFEPLAGELPDYLPLLFEFLAEKPADMAVHRLMQRMAAVCQHIADALDEQHPYRLLLAVAFARLQQTENLQSMPVAAVAPNVIPPDVDNLPYPLVYD